MVLEALDSGQPIDLQNMPPSPQGKAHLAETLSEVSLCYNGIFLHLTAKLLRIIGDHLGLRLTAYSNSNQRRKIR